MMLVAALAVATILAGALTVVFNPPEATFGWFAYAPLNGETFSGMIILNRTAAAGWAAVAAGAVLLAFCAGWLLGRRHSTRR
ncbi:hypothetical protein [Kocuria rosea]|uniref:hypothetical protein n=1 Tax=Kocuria rosea TaxID=1275 RepID=UPI00203B9D52|nr:hypothetical protein [Kocuria rosea]MCM3689016.1 hypothetical protein [Kocuria rosea]